MTELSELQEIKNLLTWIVREMMQKKDGALFDEAKVSEATK